MIEIEKFEDGRKIARTVRSFVNRDGRITDSQRKALNELLPIFSARKKELDNLSEVFCDNSPIYLEIGFGNGSNLINQAISRPDLSFLGCETYRSGIGRTLNQVDELGIGNIRLVVGDAFDVVVCLSARCLDGIFIFFPDPWPKKKHHKRRLINRQFLKTISGKITENGRIYIATDNESYAHDVVRLVECEESLENIAGPFSFSPRPSWRELTRFEGRALQNGDRIYEIIVCLKTR
ncbi:MAG: tRNA (guanosine(46)-N7)-methyltransferase TrmB [Pseudomonadota bacterium]|nr:tRNA (guanosine(46)-N7)-methyltransferase TrmB [Pseudomonadota bacterium]